MYGLDPRTDCHGEERAKDVIVDDYFWHGWKDILPEGSRMFVPDSACAPGGENLVRAAFQGVIEGLTAPTRRDLVIPGTLGFTERSADNFAMFRIGVRGQRTTGTAWR
jgi:hypothetical protein